MRLCLDEHHSPEIARQLRSRGHDVTSVAERPELRGLSDAELLRVLSEERSALLTDDVADSAPIQRALAVQGDEHGGLVFSSPRSMPRR